jgi:hypothetical protein
MLVVLITYLIGLSEIALTGGLTVWFKFKRLKVHKGNRIVGDDNANTLDRVHTFRKPLHFDLDPIPLNLPLLRKDRDQRSDQKQQTQRTFVHDVHLSPRPGKRSSNKSCCGLSNRIPIIIASTWTFP